MFDKYNPKCSLKKEKRKSEQVTTPWHQFGGGKGICGDNNEIEVWI